MAKEVISVGGEERVVREDTAKAYRGTTWALLSLAAFVIIAAILLFSGALSGLLGSAEPANSNSAPAERHVGP